MSDFPLRIVTPEGVMFQGPAQKLVVRTAGGDMAILARHTDYVAPLGMGKTLVETEKGRRYGACIGGLVRVLDGGVTLVATTFEWAEQIDGQRAAKAEQQAREELENPNLSCSEERLAKARLKRAQLRQYVAAYKE